MKRIKVSKNFYADEFIDPYSYLTLPDNGLSLIDPCIIDCTQFLRVKYGKAITVNNWWAMYEQLTKEGKSVEEIIEILETAKSIRDQSGFRPAHSTVGGKGSQHRKGKASDSRGDEQELLKIIKDNAKEFYLLGLRRIENPEITKGWLHMDTSESNHKKGFIRVVNLRSHAYDIKAL